MLSSHTTRLLKNMLRLAKLYQDNDLNLRQLVDGMEGIVNAFEEDMTPFINEWKPLWGVLEIALATNAEQRMRSDIKRTLAEIETLINSRLANNSA